MRPRGSKEDLEHRRRLAVELCLAGTSVRATAARVGCSPSSVSRWVQAYADGGESGLDAKPQIGPRARLGRAQMEQLRDLLGAGAKAHGWRSDRWTLARVAQLIEARFGVRYHISHVHRLLGRIDARQ